MSIRLSKKHGLNPTIRTCFWCGESTNEILLLGASYKGEAPMNMIAGYEPCDKCKELFAQGIQLVEVSDSPVIENQPALNYQYPTGHFWVVTEDYIKRVLQEEAATEICNAGKALISVEDAHMMGFY